MEELKKIYITFDLDFTNYIENIYFDEFNLLLDKLRIIENEIKSFKATIFLRIDYQTEKIFGIPDFFLKKYKKKIEILKNKGYVFGWHYHSYKLYNHQWNIETNESLFLDGLEHYGKISLNNSLEISRMGWGYQTNKSIKKLNDMGFKIDSSAIPRPMYKWSNNLTDWSMTSNDWYYPCRKKFQITCDDNYEILEVPISTFQIEFPTDTQKNVIRYINPAFKSEYFIKYFNKISSKNNIVSITHPYEINSINSKSYNGLISFNFDDFIKNLKYLNSINFKFKTLNYEK